MLLPEGTVTFLFTDIEGSSALWEGFPDAMQAALARHDFLLRTAIEANNGAIVKTTGDGYLAAFATAPDAIAAALAVQLTLHAEHWSAQTPLKVRAALHTGVAELRDGDYFGATLNRAARLLATGYGGQTLLSAVTQELARDALPPYVTLASLGEHRLKDLQRPEAVYQMLHPDLLQDFPPLRSLSNPALPNNLPQQTTSFIGRETEIVQVRALLKQTRLLTLTGSGGSGKTRLSLQAAAEMLDGEGDGVWFVELAPLADAALVAQTVGNVLGVKEESDKPLSQTLTNYLHSKRLLILLDNCEHLLDAVARLADTLLKNCPNVTLLATSREALNIAGETQYRVPSLSLPDAKQTQTAASLSQYEAVRLFIERALQAKTSFTVTNENAPALAQLCVQLDGIPLAIELAAARIRSLSVEEINARLDNRFRLLTGGSRAALPRQQTLRALIDWSYDLLNAQEKALLCRLSVFAGGWTLDAAEAVGLSENSEDAVEEWEILDLLSDLVDKSLALTETGATSRYRLLETVRQYAAEKLRESGEADAARNRHLAFYLALAEEAHLQLEGPEQAEWLNQLETEHDNLRAALIWAAEAPGEVEAGLRMGVALWKFWFTRGYLSEGRQRLTQALTLADNTIPAIVRANALNCAALLANHQGDYVQAKDWHEKSLALRREAGAWKGIAASLNNLGLLALDQSDYTAAKALFEEALEINREGGNSPGETINLLNLAEIAITQGDYAAATRLSEEGLQISRRMGFRDLEAGCHLNLGRTFMGQGNNAQAKALFVSALTLFQALGNKPWIANGLEVIAQLTARQAQPERAGQLWGAAEALRKEIGMPLTPEQQEEYDRDVSAAREAAGAKPFDAAWQEGRALTLEQALTLALE